MSTSQFTNKEIADYVSAVMGGAGTDAEKAAAINAAAQQHRVTREQLAASTGYGLDVVNQYLGALPTTNAGVTPTPTGALSTVTATQPVSTVDSSPLDFYSGFKQFIESNLPAQTQLTEQQQAQNYYDNLVAFNPTATKQDINTYIKETPFSSPYYDELLTLSGVTSTTPTSTGALSTVTTTGAAGNDTVTGARGNDTVTGATSVIGATGNDTVTGAADTSRNNAIKNQFLSIYDDPNKTGYQKAQEIKTLATNAKVSDAEIASALGFTGADGTTLLNTFLNQPDPTTRAIQRSFADVYNNENLTDQQKAQQINQLASTSKVSRDQIATALGISSANLNTYLDQDPTVISSLLATANSPDKPEHFSYQTDWEGVTNWVFTEQGLAANQARADAGRRLEALGYELFDPDGPEYGDEFGSYGTARPKWLSPQEAASITGTKVNNQLRQEALAKTVSQMPGLTPLAKQLGMALDPDSTGGKLKNLPSFLEEVANRFTSKTGITDLNDLAERKLNITVYPANEARGEMYFNNDTGQFVQYPTQFYNKKTGQVIPYEAVQGLGTFGNQQDETGVSFTQKPDGTFAVKARYAHEDEEWKDALLPLAIITAPFTVGSSLAALGAEELAASALASELAVADISLGGLGGSAGAASLTAGALPTAGSLVSTLTSALPTELVEAAQTLSSTFKAVKPILQAGNTLYQASQGNVVGALLSGLDAAGSSVPGAKEFGQVLNAGLAASQGNYFPALQYAIGQTGIDSELANTKIAGNFTVGDALKGASFLEALRSENPTVILNSLGSLTGSQDLKVAAAASGLVDTLKNPNATAFDIAMGVSRVSDSLNTASRQPPPTGALQTSGQSTVTGALGTDTATGAAGNDVIDEYNVTGGGGALITSGNPTEDQQIAIQQRQNAANQALADYVGPGNDLSREGFVSQLQSLGFTKDQAEGYAQQADQKINMNLVGADVMNRYSKIDPEFGTPQLDRDTAVQEMVAAGFTSDRANEILNDVDAQNASKLENRLNVQAAFNDFVSGTGTQDQLRSAMMLAGYTDAEISNIVTRGNAVLEGKRLTSGEQAQERAANLPDIRAEIAGKSSFNDAYALAREKLGSGATFSYQGKLYSTATADETKPLITTKAFDNSIQDQDIAARLNMGLDANGVRSLINEWNTADPAKRIELLRTPAFAGIKAIYDEKSVTRQLSPSEIASTVRAGASGSVTPYESNWVLAGRDLAQAIQDTVALVTGDPGNTAAILNRAGGQLLQGVGGVTSTLGADVLGGELTRAGQTIEDIGSSTSTYAQTQQGIIKAINDEPNWWNKAIIAGRSALENPGAITDWTAIEVLQEGPALLAFGAAKVGKVAAGLVADGLESMGFAHNDARDSALAAGKPITEANNIGDKAGWLSMANTMATAGVLDARGIKALQDLRAGRITQEAAKEVVGGAFDEGATTAIVQAVSTGKLDPNAIGTAAVLGGLIEGTTSAGLSTVGEGAYTDNRSINNAIVNIQTLYGNDQASTLVNNLVGSSNLAAGGQALATNLSNVMGSDAAVTTANTLVGNLAISKASDTLQNAGIDLENLSTVVGKTDAGNDITLGDALGASITGNGQQVAASTVVGTKADGTNLTLADLTSTVTKGTVNIGSKAGVDSTVTAGVKADTGVKTDTGVVTDTGVKTDTGVTTGVTTDATTGVTTDATTGITTDATTNAATQTGVTGNVNANTSTTTDANTGVTTNTAVDTNTGTTTTTTTDPNTNTTTQTTVDQNTGVNTQTTTTTNQTSTTTVDTNTNVTTNTTVDTNTNTTTNITVNTNTGEVVVKVIDNDTDKVLDTQIKTVDELTSSELEKLTITDPTTKTPVTKPPVATAPTTSRAASLAGAMALPSMLMGEETPRLRGEMLKAEGDTAIKNPLEAYMERVEEMNRVDPALMAVMAQRLGIQLPEQSQEVKFPTFTYGQETSIDDILGLNETPKEDKEEEKFAYAEGGYVEPLRAKPMNLQFMNRGGALPGGREDFKGGKHVAGDGDGQSDDIPAWLADGEFVFPADVVSALGNGSTKAGTDKLYKMMHEIRARARSTKVKDLPPPAHKSPLDYIKKGK